MNAEKRVSRARIYKSEIERLQDDQFYKQYFGDQNSDGDEDFEARSSQLAEQDEFDSDFSINSIEFQQIRNQAKNQEIKEITKNSSQKRKRKDLSKSPTNHRQRGESENQSSTKIQSKKLAKINSKKTSSKIQKKQSYEDVYLDDEDEVKGYKKLNKKGNVLNENKESSFQNNMMLNMNTRSRTKSKKIQNNTSQTLLQNQQDLQNNQIRDNSKKVNEQLQIKQLNQRKRQKK